MDSNILKIFELYNNIIEELDDTKARHFLTRAYFATNDHKYLDKLSKYSFTFEEDLKLIHEFGNFSQTSLSSVSDFVASRKAYKDSDKIKYNLWKENPQFVLIHKGLNALYYKNLLDPNFIASINLEFNFDEYLSNLINKNDLLLYSSTYVINIFYWVSNLLGIDRTSDLKKTFIKEFDDQQIENNKYNYLYGLGHIVLGESNFYTQSIDHSNLSEIIKKYEEISYASIKDLNLDVIIETILCKCLLKIDIRDFQQFIDESIKMVEQYSYLPRGGSAGAVESEHVSSNFAVLLSKLL